MKEQLLHILDQSVCLTRKQMREYLSGAMLPEEAHAAELHLNACPLCHLALEGFEEHSDEALKAIAALNSGFLKEHFDNISPQIHLNSMAPAASLPAAHRSRARHLPLLWRIGSVAAGILLLFGLVWAFERRHNSEPLPAPFVAGEGIQATQHTSPRGVPNAASASQERPKATMHTPAPAFTDAATGTPKASPASSNAAGAPAAAASLPAGDVPAPVKPIDATPKPAASSAPDGAASHYYQEYDATSNGSESSTGNGSTESKKAAASAESSKPAKPRESYSEGAAEAVLNACKQSMKSPDPTIRYQSMIKAAQCYEALGQQAKAEELLQKVMDEAPGRERRAARRALRKMR